MLRVANAVVAVVAVCLVMASCVLASIRSASAGANYKWFQPNLVRRNGHSHRHHHVRTHVDVLENASHPPETVIRAPSVIAPVIPTVSLSVPVHAVPAIPPAGVSTVYTPSVLTVMRRPVVTGFLHSPLPHHPPPLPPIPHSPVVPIVHHHHTSTGAPTPVPVYATFISHGPPNVKQRTVLLHHHHHHHRHVEAKSLTLNGLPVVVDPVAYNRKFQNSASEDEIIIKERDLAQLLHNKYTQFSDHSFEPARGQSYVRQDYHERKKAKFYYSVGARVYRNSRKLHSRPRNPEDSEDELQRPNPNQNNYALRSRGERIDLSYAVRADRALNGRNVVVIIPKK